MQKQIESLKKKGASQALALREARAEAVGLRGMAMDAQMELKQSNTDGPRVRKLEAEVLSLRDKLHEAQLQTNAEAEARQQVIREAGQFEESAESAAVQLHNAKVGSQRSCAFESRPNEAGQAYRLDICSLQEEVSNLQRECGHLKLQVTQLQHSLREGEKRLEKAREQLATSISKEERFQTRGKQAYARIRAAWACAKGTSKAAGAIATASREMRPVEIVSIYEEQKAQVCLPCFLGSSCIVQMHAFTSGPLHDFTLRSKFLDFYSRIHGCVRFVQVEADVKRLSAENAVLLSQVRDLENKVTLASRELSNSGTPVAAVRTLPACTLADGQHLQSVPSLHKLSWH